MVDNLEELLLELNEADIDLVWTYPDYWDMYVESIRGQLGN